MSKKLPLNPTRAMFVESQKSMSKRFVASLVNVLMKNDSSDESADVAWNLGVLKHAIQNVKSPAKLWDSAPHDAYREVYWDAVCLALEEEASEHENEINVLQNLAIAFRSTDHAELNQIEDDDDFLGLSSSDSDDGDDNDGKGDDGDIFSGDASDLDGDDSGDDDDDLTPPDVLYHATPTKNVNGVMREGLRSMSRQNVYLWEDQDKAEEVAARHGDPDITVFWVDVPALLNSGGIVKSHDFQRGEGLQWFTQEVPAVFLTKVND